MKLQMKWWLSVDNIKIIGQDDYCQMGEQLFSFQIYLSPFGCFKENMATLFFNIILICNET